MVFWIIVTAANLIVGVLVGLCGVAGFLLPLVYTGPLGMEITEGLALSFGAFILSGILGSVNYRKAGNLDIPFGIRLSAGSLAGAILGVKLNLIIPENAVKTLLYLVVLLSGISILLRKDKPGQDARSPSKEDQISRNLPAALALGFFTGAICSMSGAGGPVLVMPILVVLGVEVRTAVGVALFNSIFIGIPACIGLPYPMFLIQAPPHKRRGPDIPRDRGNCRKQKFRPDQPVPPEKGNRYFLGLRRGVETGRMNIPHGNAGFVNFLLYVSKIFFH